MSTEALPISGGDHDSASFPEGGYWLQTYTGRAFSLTAPQASEIEVLDVAHALAMTCRYGGHVHAFYSVAQHCVLVSRAAPEHLAFAGLLHDAHEAYLGDLVRDLKRALRLSSCGRSDYDNLAARLDFEIEARFGLPTGSLSSAEIKRYDLVVLATEKRDLMRGHREWAVQRTHEVLPERIVPLDPRAAERLFLERFFEVRP